MATSDAEAGWGWGSKISACASNLLAVGAEGPVHKSVTNIHTAISLDMRAFLQQQQLSYPQQSHITHTLTS
jgi:hypothetical protein